MSDIEARVARLERVVTIGHAVDLANYDDEDQAAARAKEEAANAKAEEAAQKKADAAAAKAAEEAA